MLVGHFVGASGDGSQGDGGEFRFIILFQKLKLKAEDEVMIENDLLYAHP